MALQLIWVCVCVLLLLCHAWPAKVGGADVEVGVLGAWQSSMQCLVVGGAVAGLYMAFGVEGWTGWHCCQPFGQWTGACMQAECTAPCFIPGQRWHAEAVYSVAHAGCGYSTQLGSV